MVNDMAQGSGAPKKSVVNEGVLGDDGTIGVWCFEVSGIPRIHPLFAAEPGSVCRHAVRLLLAHRGKLAPEEITFTTGTFGKPKVDLGVNYSSSADDAHAAIAITATGEIGIDLQIKPVEVVDLETLVGGQLTAVRIKNHRTLWARIEAVVKCRGIGFRLPVTALMVKQLEEPEGSLDVHGARVWWRDLPHEFGSLCLANERPIKRVEFHCVPWKLTAPQQP